MVNIKHFTNTIKFLTIIFSLTTISFAQTNWLGEYFFGEDGGRTAGGSVIYIAHTIKITEKNGKFDAHINSRGFQTSRDVYADVKIVGDKIEFYYREDGLHQYTAKYEKGDLLLSFEKKELDGTTKILTRWNAFESILTTSDKSGEVYFEKTEVKQNIASDNQGNINNKWLRFETKDKGFSVALPTSTLINAKKTMFDRYILHGYENGVTMSLTAHTRSVAKTMERAIKRRKKKGNTKPSRNNGTNTKIGRYFITTINYLSPTEGYTRTMFINSGKDYYRLFVSSPDLNNETFNRFLMSLKFDGQRIVKDAKIPNYSEKVVLLEKPQSSPEVIEAFKRKPAKIDRKVTYQIGNAQYDSPERKQINYSRKAIILEKPNSKSNSSVSRRGFSKVILEVELLANGQVGDVVAITDGDEQFAKDCCVSVIKKLKFIPAQIDGKNVNSTEVLEYSILSIPSRVRIN